MKHILCTLLLLACAALMSCQQQRQPYPVFFLTETNGYEGGAAFTLAYGGHYYNRMPVLALKHCAKFKSFMDMQTGSYGVTLYLKDEYRNRLYFTTQENVGRRLLPIVNGLAFQPTMIDAPISDGKLIIWSGLNGYDLKRISRTVEPVDPEMEEKRYLSSNPRPIPETMRSAKGKLRDAHGRPIQEIESARN